MGKELIVLTRAQLEEIIEETVHKTLSGRERTDAPRMLIGVKEISNHLGISMATCQRYLRSGVFGDSVFYVGRQVRGYSDRLMECVARTRGND